MAAGEPLASRAASSPAWAALSRRFWAGVRLLALPIAVLLWLQWPLRDLGLPGSLLANDVAQAIFALYACACVAAAVRAQAHFVTHPRAPSASRVVRCAGALVTLPWCVWVVVSSAGPAWRSVLQLEGFPETAHPGYFLIKLALLLLGLLLGVQAVTQAWREWR